MVLPDCSPGFYWRTKRRLRMIVPAIFTNKSQRPKLLFAAVCLFFLMLYLFPGFLKQAKKQLTPSASDCLDSLLSDYSGRLDSLDARLIRYSERGQSQPELLGFVGNGRYGLTLRHGVVVVGDQSGNLGVTTQFSPLINVDTQHSSFSGAYVLDYRSGLIINIQAFLQERKCLSVEQSLMFHRTHSNLFIQSFVVRNEMGHSSLIELKTATTNPKPTDQIEIETDKYSIYESTSADASIVFMQQQPASSFQVEARSKTAFTILSAVNHSRSISLENLKQRLIQSTTQLAASRATLVPNHISAWNKIWTSGISVGDSPETSAPSPISINETIYSLLSASEDPLLQVENLTEDERIGIVQLVKHPDHTCFTGTPNIDAIALWNSPAGWTELASLVDIWHLTLQKHGCSRLLTAGLSGLYEAMMLSVFSLQFSEDHLSLKSQPEFFHRNMSLRGVTYKDCSLNLGIVLLPDGRAEMRLSSSSCSPGFHLYACETGCPNPVLLSGTEVTLPVRETSPHTPILYISESEAHLMDLRRVIHYKSIRNYLSKEQLARKPHDTILPAFLWVLIASVIVAFHVFLVILLYREYWLGGGKDSGGDRDYEPKMFMPSYNISKYSYVTGSGGTGSGKSNSFKK